MRDLKVNVWIGCYATYSDGYLFDKQYEVTCNDELDDAIEEAEKYFLECIKKERPDWHKEGYITGTYCEELYVADYEASINGEYIDIGDSESFENIRDFLDLADISLMHDACLLIKVAKSRGMDFEEIKDLDDSLLVFEVDSESKEDLARGYIEMTGMLDTEELRDSILAQYFDYKAFGRDLAMEYTVFEANGTYYAVSDY